MNRVTQLHSSLLTYHLDGPGASAGDTPKKLWKKVLSTTTACAAVGFSLPASAREHCSTADASVKLAVREVTASLAPPPCTRRGTHTEIDLEVPCKPPRARKRRGRGSGGGDGDDAENSWDGGSGGWDDYNNGRGDNWGGNGDGPWWGSESEGEADDSGFWLFQGLGLLCLLSSIRHVVSTELASHKQGGAPLGINLTHLACLSCATSLASSLATLGSEEHTAGRRLAWPLHRLVVEG
uniref:Uncharacterized protein n=1 Tax=Pyramimonas obovata TaxID=1411642 RepID=A0A7S0REI4_9CHLO|mmetsp:Transcript_32245/g.70346  ORF Transcript_32245/g.70346 Transcript_32245/m.70346 type:complete len:238 (+) Transcript_32245:210-923(+)|eukprot:CAMPEP_0118925740 /NCGR_PEP_ID=MMETSP1169-20130426/3573_1 /TAXON_ID=36882 /ORGANISM="Pyramimonas obovata, Strain CCMP722" /LENGTH=237 /DNA_ID=CAMNT_0006867121 /DNA_START=177 /DNA_END=890 /DNA_ORIENTATION=-